MGMGHSGQKLIFRFHFPVTLKCTRYKDIKKSNVMRYDRISLQYQPLIVKLR
jgi:hypothetical protein